MFTTADISFYAVCGMMVHRMLPERGVDTRCPRLADWPNRMKARPGVKAALEMPDYTAPGAVDVYGLCAVGWLTLNVNRQCEMRSDVAIHDAASSLDCRAALAMTGDANQLDRGNGG